jgi:hypothetical protein
MKLRIKNTKLTLKIIGWLQIVGGITGLGLIIHLLLNTLEINGAVLFIFLTGISVFIFSIYTGKKLLVSENKREGIIYSIINQTLQFFQWCLFGFSFGFSSGGAILFGIQGFSFNMDFSIITSTFQMAVGTDKEYFLKINLFAALILIVLIDVLKETTLNKTINLKETTNSEKITEREELDAVIIKNDPI